VRVDAQGNVWLGVAEALADRDDIDAGVDQLAGMGVPQRVERRLRIEVRPGCRDGIGRKRFAFEGREDHGIIGQAPGAEFHLALDREVYLLPPALAQELPGEFYMATLYTTISRQNVVFLWPVRLPSSDGRVIEWHRSAASAAEHAMRRWVRVKANMGLGAYELFEAASTVPDPEWPAVSFQELIEIAFRDRLITNLDHPAIKRLRG